MTFSTAAGHLVYTTSKLSMDCHFAHMAHNTAMDSDGTADVQGPLTGVSMEGNAQVDSSSPENCHIILIEAAEDLPQVLMVKTTFAEKKFRLWEECSLADREQSLW
jgi:hypothetical protein